MTLRSLFTYKSRKEVVWIVHPCNSNIWKVGVRFQGHFQQTLD